MHADQRYISALINNEINLIEEIYKKYAQKIKWMVLKNGGDVNDAADIFQEGLVAIFLKARQGNFVLTCPFEMLLYVVCKNKWITELNKRKARNITFVDTMEFPHKEDCFQQIDEYIQQQKRNDLLKEKIAELGENSRCLLQLSWSGKSMDEVAKLMNVTYGYARKKKSECIAKLIQRVRRSPKFNSLKW